MRRNLLLMMSILLISSCTFLPVPLAYLNYARTAYDVKQIIADKPTLTDAILSSGTDMDCRLVNALDGEDVCKEKVIDLSDI
jgi:hypothetical protein